MSDLDTLLRGMESAGSSDLHLRSKIAPRYRIDGELHDVVGHSVLTSENIHELCSDRLNATQKRAWVALGVVNVGFSGTGARFRACFFHDQSGPAVSIRRLPQEIPSLQELDLPEVIESFAHRKDGLVLVTGATGSGKSTTLAALIDVINSQYRKFIVTLEDPIELVHTCKKSIIHQRGVGYDILDFDSGVQSSSDLNPHVLMVGEMRHPETIRLTLSAAERGALVFSTLHANSAVETIDRIIDAFPSREQPLVRSMLAQSLAGVVSQALLRRGSGSGRIPATEVLIANNAITNLIRDGKTAEIYNMIQVGKSQGMHSLDDSLEQLLQRKEVDPEEALFYAVNKTRFERFALPHLRPSSEPQSSTRPSRRSREPTSAA